MLATSAARILPMKALALGAIRLYQRYLSPHKGFCCAYAAISGRCSCSALGYRAIRRYGVLRGISVLDRRLEKCGIAYRRHLKPRQSGMLAHQGGFIDCACDIPTGCDLPSCDALELPFNCCDGFSGGGCDWRRSRKDEDDDYVLIPVRGDRTR